MSAVTVITVYALAFLYSGGAMLTPAEERIVTRAARAQHRYWQLVRSRGEDDSRRRQALMLRYIAVQNELQAAARGPQVLEGPPDLSLTLEQAVRLELERIKPAVRFGVAARRDRRRLAVGCGPVQLARSHASSVRQHLRRIVFQSPLSIREAAAAIGFSSSTLERHLAGDAIGQTRREWYHRLEAIETDGPFARLIVRVHQSRKRWGWRTRAIDEGDA